MKKSLIIAPALLAVLSCSRNKQPAEPLPDAMQVEMGMRELPVLEFSDSVEFAGHKYVYHVLRQPVDSLPPAHDDMFGDTRDNSVRLSVMRDGGEYFSRTFTKGTFRSSIPEDFYGTAILDGISFLEAKAGEGLTFVLSVSEPDSDQTLPFAVTIAADGSYSFRQVSIDFIGEDSI